MSPTRGRATDLINVTQGVSDICKQCEHVNIIAQRSHDGLGDV